MVDTPIVFLDDICGQGGDRLTLRLMAEEAAHRYGAQIITKSELLKEFGGSKNPLITDIEAACQSYLEKGFKSPKFIFGVFSAEVESPIIKANNGIIVRREAEVIANILTGREGLVCTGLTDDILAEQAEAFRKYFPGLSDTPLIALHAVLGSTPAHSSETLLYNEPPILIPDLSPYDISVFCEELCQQIKLNDDFSRGGTIFISSSPRTDGESLELLLNNMKAKASEHDLTDQIKFMFYDYRSQTLRTFNEEAPAQDIDFNPYRGLLALADRHLVLGKSNSTISEIVFTGKPFTYNYSLNRSSFGDYINMGTGWCHPPQYLREVRGNTEILATREYEALDMTHKVLAGLFGFFEKHGLAVIVPDDQHSGFENPFGVYNSCAETSGGLKVPRGGFEDSNTCSFSI
jgi:hypothetical protein